MVAFTGNSVGDTATYTCNPGFELIGGATTTCTQVDANSAVFPTAQQFCRRECTKYTPNYKHFLQSKLLLRTVALNR